MSAVGRLYKVTGVAVTVAAQQDIVYLKPAADKICVVEFAVVSVVGGAADAGDAQEELLDVELVRLPATVTVGSGGGSFTPIPQLVNDVAAGATARINDTTKATTSGTRAVMHADGANSRQPFLWYPKDTQEEYIANAAAIVLELNTTPADALAVNFTVAFRELP